MNTPLPDEFESLAALHALGLLEGPQAHEFEAQAADGEAKTQALRYRQTAADLLEVASPRQPPPSLRERLLARLPGGGKPAAPPGEIDLGPGILLVRGQQKPWEETGIPGIRRKTLHFDAGRNYASNLVSMAAGSVYPRHWHSDIEELYLLSGQVRLNGHLLDVGDYCRAEPGSVHEDVVAASDCVFIALASANNEFRRPAADAR